MSNAGIIYVFNILTEIQLFSLPYFVLSFYKLYCYQTFFLPADGVLKEAT